MKKIIPALFLLLQVQILLAQKTAFIANQVIVQLKPTVMPEDIVSAFNVETGILPQFKHEKELSRTMHAHLFTFDATYISALDVIRQLQQLSGVAVAQVNHIIQDRQIPNDSFFGQLWHHVQSGDHDIDSDLAWDITTGGVTAFGDEIVVCVVEGGGAKWDQADIIDNHWVNENEIANNGIDDDGNGYVDDYDGWNISDDNDNISAGNHGTQVSSMIGAKGNNALGITGVNWDVKIMQVQLGGISENNVIEAYEYPLAMRKLYNQSNGNLGAFVVATNSSWGIDGGDPNEAPLWCAMYDSLGYYGVLSAGSTANNNVNVDIVGDLPTACPSDYMISVTATNNNDVRTFSGYGITTIDIGAPGENVYLAGNNNYSNTSGTSFAGPCVAGAIALLYSAPCASFMEMAYASPSAAALDIRSHLMNGVDQVANLSDEVVSGGRLNVNNSLQMLLQNCSEGSCVQPFAVNASQLDQTLDYTVNWGTTSSMLNFDIQYQVVGSDAIYIMENVGLPPYTIAGLLPCTPYQLQVIAHCAEESSNWSSVYTWTTDGCCTHPALPVASVITNNSATINWSPVLAASSYHVIVLENGMAFAQYNDVNTTSLQIGPLNPCAQYTVSVSSICGDIPTNTQSLAFNTTGCGSCQDLTYCDVDANANLEHIAEVTVDNYTNTSGSDGGYIFVEESTIAIANDQTYDIALTPGFAASQYSEYFKVWIDYNSDGTFQNNEIIFESEQSSMNQVTGLFTVPSNLSQGVTRMRVSMSYVSPFGGTTYPVECGDSGDGEIEDYCVTLLGNVSIADVHGFSPFRLYPNPAENHLQIITTLTDVNYSIYDQTGKRCSSGMINGSSIDLTAFAPGVYTIGLVHNGQLFSHRFIKI